MDPGCYGNEYHKTPSIDRLAEEGMKFTNAYSNAANCAPSRACLLTGRYVHRHGVYTVGSAERFDRYENLLDWDELYLISAENNEGFSPEFPVISESFKKAGYATALFGKVHSFFPPDNWPHMTEINQEHCRYIQQKGFDEVRVARNFNHLGSNYSTPDTVINTGKPLNKTLTEHAVKFIDENTERPFFLYLSYILPHEPYKAMEDLIAEFENIPPSDRLKVKNPTYAAMLSMLDQSVNNILSALKESGLENRTLIIFTSDNGAPTKVYDGNINIPLRGTKGQFYEGGIRVPMIVKWPDKIKPGTICNEPVSMIDFFPSFLDIISIDQDLKTELDGESLLPLLTGKSEDLQRESIFWYFPGYLPGRTRPLSAIRWENFKLIENHEDGSLELYDLESDISETKNLANEHPHLTKTVYRELKKLQERTGAKIPPVNPNWDPDNEGRW